MCIFGAPKGRIPAQTSLIVDARSMAALAEEHSFADPDWAGSGSPLCWCLHKAEESTDEDQSAWVSVKLRDSSAKHGIFAGQLFLSER